MKLGTAISIAHLKGLWYGLRCITNKFPFHSQIARSVIHEISRLIESHVRTVQLGTFRVHASQS